MPLSKTNNKKKSKINSTQESDEMKKFWEEVKKIDLKKLYKSINPKNYPDYKEFETKPIGKEIW